MSKFAPMLTLFSALCCVQCKTAGVEHSRGKAETDPYTALSNRLRTPLSPSDVQIFLGDLHRTPLSQTQLNQILALTFAAMHSPETILPVIGALSERHANPNALMPSNLTLDDKEIKAKGYKQQEESYACGIIDAYASSVQAKLDDLHFYRSYLSLGVDGEHIDSETIHNQFLKCSSRRNDVPAAGVRMSGTIEDSEIGEYCVSKLPDQGLPPSCPRGWTPVQNKVRQGESEYLTGCEHSREAPPSIPESHLAKVRQQCPGRVDFESSSEDQIIGCWSDAPLPHLQCPSGYSTKRRPKVVDNNERDEAMREALPAAFLTVCSRPGINVLEGTEPYARRIADFHENIKKEQSALRNLIVKMTAAGAKFDQPCRSYKSLEQEFTNGAIYGSEQGAMATPTPSVRSFVGPPTTRDITTSQILVVNLNAQDWVVKATVHGRCPISVVGAAVDRAVDQIDDFAQSGPEHIYVSEASHDCGLESVYAVDTRNSARIRGLLKEEPENILALPVLTRDEVFNRFK